MAPGKERAASKQISALQKKLGPQQILWGLSATVILDFATPSMRVESDGILASTDAELHFYRKSLLGGQVYETLDITMISAWDLVTAGFSDGNVEVIRLNRAQSGAFWGVAVAVAGDDRRQFLLAHLASSGIREQATTPPGVNT